MSRRVVNGVLIVIVLLLTGANAAPFSPNTAAVAEPGALADVAGTREHVERQAILGLVNEHRHLAGPAWRQSLADVIYEESVAVGVDPLLIAAIVARESSFRTRVVSRCGAVGLMQLRPFVARELARRQKIDWNGHDTLQSPELNVRLGATYFRQLFERFEEDPRLALAAYHRGPTRLRRQLDRGPLGDSRYVDGVLGVYQRLDMLRHERLMSPDRRALSARAHGDAAPELAGSTDGPSQRPGRPPSEAGTTV